MVHRESLPARACQCDLTQRLQVSWLLGANFSSQATGVSDHRNFCKIQMVADSHDFTGCYWRCFFSGWFSGRIYSDVGWRPVVPGVFIYGNFPTPTWTTLAVRFPLISNVFGIFFLKLKFIQEFISIPFKFQLGSLGSLFWLPALCNEGIRLEHKSLCKILWLSRVLNC